MHMLNPYCGVDRDPRGVVRLTICNAGSLNILGSAVINGVREGLEALATERQIRVLVIAGQSEKSMIGGADIKEMATLDQASAEKFITGLARSLRGRAGVSGAGDRADAGLVPRRRARIRRRLRFPDRGARRQIRHARGQGRHSLGDPCGAAAAADRLGPRPLADHDRRDHRRADRAGLGAGRRGRAEGGLDAAVERTVATLLECGPEALRAQKALLRQWEELPLKESVDLSIGVFGQSFLTGEPQRLMQGFIDRKR